MRMINEGFQGYILSGKTLLLLILLNCSQLGIESELGVCQKRAERNRQKCNLAYIIGNKYYFSKDTDLSGDVFKSTFAYCQAKYLSESRCPARQKFLPENDK